MIITCPACKKEHLLGKESLPKDVKKVRCSFCHASFALPPSCADSIPRSIPAIAAAPHRLGLLLNKGSVGKTTTAVHLAAGLACNGKKVLLVDTDPEGRVAHHLGISPPFGLADFITGKAQAKESICLARKGLWLLAGGGNLAAMKQFIDRQDFGGENTLADKLGEIEDDYDYVLVDTSPVWDSLAVNVFFYVGEVLLPVSLETVTLQGLSQFADSLKRIKTTRHAVTLRYILPTFYDLRVQDSSEILDGLSETFADQLCAPIRHNVTLCEASALGKTVYEYAPGASGAKDYRLLTERILLDHEMKDGGAQRKSALSPKGSLWQKSMSASSG